MLFVENEYYLKIQLKSMHPEIAYSDLLEVTIVFINTVVYKMIARFQRFVHSAVRSVANIFVLL